MASNVHVVRLDSKRFDSSTGPTLRNEMAHAWDAGAMVVILDLAAVTYIDSLGISALIAEQRRRPQGSSIVLCSLTDYVRDVLEVTQLVRVFDVYHDARAAEAAFET